MANASRQPDAGDVQSRRIELSEKNGKLLRIWAAGFLFVFACRYEGLQLRFLMNTCEKLQSENISAGQLGT